MKGTRRKEIEMNKVELSYPLLPDPLLAGFPSHEPLVLARLAVMVDMRTKIRTCNAHQLWRVCDVKCS